MPEKCISCHKNDVTWPRVCVNCRDSEAQAELFLLHLADGVAGYDEDGIGYDEMTCRTCGMIYDGGMRCTYCGDANPTDDPEMEEENEL